MKTQKRKAVAPVIATLLMIAVAVAMSVIIFMWSQGFLSNTSSATGGQQGAQNQAAQSSISIEAGTFSLTKATVIVRNVGAVGIQLGLVSITGISSNSGYSGATTYVLSIPSTVSACVATVIDLSPTTTTCSLAKGAAAQLQSAALTGLISGDVINIKVTTTVGTFAQAQFTVP